MIEVCEQELANRPDLDNVRRQLLVDALEYYHKLIEQRGDDPTAQADLVATQARAQKVLGELTVLQGSGQYHFLAEPSVRDDLRLSDEQRAKVAEVTERLDRRGRDLFRDFHRLSGEERQRRFLDLARASEAEVRAVLTAEQRHRLHQVALQLQGPRAFEDPDVLKALNLTAAQKAQIRSITADAFFGGHCGPPPGPGMGKPPEPHDDPASSAVAKIESLLTKAQAQKWKDLTGERFHGKVRMHPGQPPDGRRGGPGKPPPDGGRGGPDGPPPPAPSRDSP